MTFLLDTNVVSELIKRRKNPGVLDWLAATSRHDHHLSVMSVGEIRRGISLLRLRNDHEQAGRVERWLAETVRDFAHRIVPVSVDAAQRWGHQDAVRPMPITDGLIGATAAAHEWTLVTRNTRDFEHLGVPLLNPFTEEAAP
jgi:predicted nucleic acid-binding protein